MNVTWNKGEPPLDGTWIYARRYNGDILMQYDKTAFEGRGSWFTDKGHITKGPDKVFGWMLQDDWVALYKYKNLSI